VIETSGKNPCIAIDPSAKVFALGLGNNSIRMYSFGEAGSGPFLSEPFNDNMRPHPVDWVKMEFSNNGKYLLISTNSNVCYLLDALKGTLLHRLTGHLNTLGVPLEANFTPDGNFVLCGKLLFIRFLGR
jgi:COMPASS component SWD2